MAQNSIFFLLVFYAESALAQKNSQMDKKINIEIENGSIGAYLSTIISQGINLSMSNNKLSLDKKVNIKKGIYTLKILLNLLFVAEPVSFLEKGSKIVIYNISRASQLLTISGFVYSGDGKEALPGATVRILNTNIAVSCNDYGYYTIELPENKYSIQASYIGFVSQTDTLALNKAVKKTLTSQWGYLLLQLKLSHL